MAQTARLSTTRGSTEDPFCVCGHPIDYHGYAARPDDRHMPRFDQPVCWSSGCDCTVDKADLRAAAGLGQP